MTPEERAMLALLEFGNWEDTPENRDLMRRLNERALIFQVKVIRKAEAEEREELILNLSGAVYPQTSCDLDKGRNDGLLEAIKIIRERGKP